tara:strand:+ start:18366 stop:18794 length:429 start_codon:yes stop_codon:yes gene_type:complete
MKEHYNKLANLFSKSTINKTLQAEVIISQGKSEFIFTTTAIMHNEIETIHNAYLFMAAESAAFLAANSLVEDVMVLAKSFEINYLRPTSSKKLNVSAKFIEKSMGNYYILVELTENKNLVVRAKGVFRRSKKPLENIKNYNQ